MTLVHIFNGWLMFKCSVKVHLKLVVVRGRELSVFSTTPHCCCSAASPCFWLLNKLNALYYIFGHQALYTPEPWPSRTKPFCIRGVTRQCVQAMCVNGGYCKRSAHALPHSEFFFRMINSYCNSVPNYSVLPLYYKCRLSPTVRVFFSQDKRGELSAYVRPGKKK